MNLKPSESLSENEVKSGLGYVVKDGLFTEAMTTMTSGAFLVALAIKLGASNFQIGLLAALPTFANVFQLFAISLVRRYNNRRILAIICSFIARFPLLLIAALPLMFSAASAVKAMIFLLFFHYFFGAMVGPMWNSWMKDLVPQKILGSYFAQRTRLIQILNVSLSLIVALSLDYVKLHFPAMEIPAYLLMFIGGGLLGMIAIFMMSKTPEPKAEPIGENLFRLVSKPLKNKNYRNLIIFQSVWSFALNLATPFFSVYMMKSLHLPLSYIIGFTILSQVSSIAFIRIWGKYSDQFSNKTIISICAPLYVFAILAWSFTGIASLTFPLLALIHIITGMTTAGINLGLNNIGLKLAPANDAIVFLAARNMVTALVPSLAPIIGGLMADFFLDHDLVAKVGLKGMNLSHWSFFFAIGSLMALASLRLLKLVKEDGETSREVVVARMMHRLKIRMIITFQRRRRNARLAWMTIPVMNRLFQKKA